MVVVVSLVGRGGGCRGQRTSRVHLVGASLPLHHVSRVHSHLHYTASRLTSPLAGRQGRPLVTQPPPGESKSSLKLRWSDELLQQAATSNSLLYEGKASSRSEKQRLSGRLLALIYQVLRFLGLLGSDEAKRCCEVNNTE